MRSKQGLSSKKRIPITQMNDNGAKIRKMPSTLKPARTRQLIRRFHTLLKNKSEILSRIGLSGNKEITEANYREFIHKDGRLEKIYQSEREETIKKLKLNKLPREQGQGIDKLKIEDLAAKLGKIDGEIAKRGGLKVYQIASIKGQDQKRGGDSSKKMVKWLTELDIWKDPSERPTALEIGSLSSRNCISSCSMFKKVTRIDLNSQEPGLILQQDFLKRPLPKGSQDQFDLISCSLVLNFVTSAEARGDMLKRITCFLKQPSKAVESKPLFFLVLPLPCVTNSRYCNKQTIGKIMTNLGFTCLKFHESSKLAYWLYQWKGSDFISKKFIFKKKEILSGSKRNNFCVVIEKDNEDKR
ncbi:hypothetical protein FOA43_003992 [Brettanomyces nanus]|uniref:25S rRNA adenine-N(1) methyltransferase n=1 Tax=Eeniella nana TaxID=13502 RepID=A0A875RQD4_EENNA|nr:uncharacterized protein FOA43_003992 [Brettanomyces nanus]QPG76600.1 hypothetical protein FOA43_003992 [Brettanomyces nanus]